MCSTSDTHIQGEKAKQIGTTEVFIQIATWKWGTPTHTTHFYNYTLFVRNGSVFSPSSGGKKECKYEIQVQNLCHIKENTISPLPVDCQVKQAEIDSELRQESQPTKQPWPLKNRNFFLIEVFSVCKLFEVLLADSPQPHQHKPYEQWLSGAPLQCCPLKLLLSCGSVLALCSDGQSCLERGNQQQLLCYFYCCCSVFSLVMHVCCACRINICIVVG